MSVGITRDEVELLVVELIDRGDFDRASVWAGVLLAENDPESADA